MTSALRPLCMCASMHVHVREGWGNNFYVMMTSVQQLNNIHDAGAITFYLKIIVETYKHGI